MRSFIVWIEYRFMGRNLRSRRRVEADSSAAAKRDAIDRFRAMDIVGQTPILGVDWDFADH